MSYSWHILILFTERKETTSSQSGIWVISRRIRFWPVWFETWDTLWPCSGSLWISGNAEACQITLAVYLYCIWIVFFCFLFFKERREKNQEDTGVWNQIHTTFVRGFKFDSYRISTDAFQPGLFKLSFASLAMWHTDDAEWREIAVLSESALLLTGQQYWEHQSMGRNQNKWSRVMAQEWGTCSTFFWLENQQMANQLIPRLTWQTGCRLQKHTFVWCKAAPKAKRHWNLSCYGGIPCRLVSTP